MSNWGLIIAFLLLFGMFGNFLIKLDNCPFPQARKLDLIDAYIIGQVQFGSYNQGIRGR